MRATSEEIAIFVAVVESGSFSRAAEQLGQANSAVSRAVKKLESKLGVSLLNRTTRQLSLTEEGERYFRRMQVVLQEMAAAENDLLETRTTPRGLLMVGRGAVYSKQTARFQSHDRCSCKPELLYRREPEPPEVRRLSEQWSQATAGHSGKAAIEAWRQYVTGQRAQGAEA